MDTTGIIPDWAWGLNCAITVADKACNIIYMNERARETYRNHGNLIGSNLRNCHNSRSIEIIDNILATGGSNAYTIEKEGLHKMIYQSAWKLDGEVGGIVEISMVIPAQLPHYIRKPAKG